MNFSPCLVSVAIVWRDFHLLNQRCSWLVVTGDVRASTQTLLASLLGGVSASIATGAAGCQLAWLALASSGLGSRVVTTVSQTKQGRVVCCPVVSQMCVLVNVPGRSLQKKQTSAYSFGAIYKPPMSFPV